MAPHPEASTAATTSEAASTVGRERARASRRRWGGWWSIPGLWMVAPRGVVRGLREGDSVAAMAAPPPRSVQVRDTPRAQAKRPCTSRRACAANLPRWANSGRVALRHPKRSPYRCFLPDLTGFGALRRAGPNPQRRPSAAVMARSALEADFDPAIAVCGFRAPLVPRLARPQPHGSKPHSLRQRCTQAERAGFEPAKDCSLRDFQSRALGQLRYLSVCSPLIILAPERAGQLWGDPTGASLAGAWDIRVL